MKIIRYFIEFILISFLFSLFKILGYRLSSNLGAIIGSIFGPLFRSKKKILSNINNAFQNINEKDVDKIIQGMWANYGRILSEYVFIKDFRNSRLKKFLHVEGEEILKIIKKNNKPVIFISGHFNNFELMAMEIEKNKINLAAIYRPLNNTFLNKTMESIRKKYICKNQIKKGISGTRKVVKFFKEGHSIALMIDQRVSEGILSKFFDRPASTTTIPAQLVKKYDCEIVPIYIERKDNIHFKMIIQKPISFKKDDTIDEITEQLNFWLESMIKKNPSQWIWSHDRWK
jgi:Kdo2-lipid IVA lauroyltransferase/acyltransferase